MAHFYMPEECKGLSTQGAFVIILPVPIKLLGLALFILLLVTLEEV